MLDRTLARVFVLTLALGLTLQLALTRGAAAGPDKASARVAAAATAYASALARFSAGAASPEHVYVWSTRWLDAQRDQPLKGKDLAAAAAAHLERMTALAGKVDALFAGGGATALDRDAAAYYQREAELWVERKGKR
jgi:hypothetical protein